MTKAGRAYADFEIPLSSSTSMLHPFKAPCSGLRTNHQGLANLVSRFSCKMILKLVHLSYRCMKRYPRQNYDLILRGEANDICGICGFLTAIRDCLRIASNGVLWSGVPCSRSLGLN